MGREEDKQERMREGERERGREGERERGRERGREEVEGGEREWGETEREGRQNINIEHSCFVQV